MKFSLHWKKGNNNNSTNITSKSNNINNTNNTNNGGRGNIISKKIPEKKNNIPMLIPPTPNELINIKNKLKKMKKVIDSDSD